MEDLELETTILIPASSAMPASPSITDHHLVTITIATYVSNLNNDPLHEISSPQCLIPDRKQVSASLPMHCGSPTSCYTQTCEHTHMHAHVHTQRHTDITHFNIHMKIHIHPVPGHAKKEKEKENKGR